VRGGGGAITEAPIPSQSSLFCEVHHMEASQGVSHVYYEGSRHQTWGWTDGEKQAA